MAVASLVLGLLWLWGVGAVLAIVFGEIARHQLKGSDGRQTGTGLAMAGRILGAIGVVVPFVLYVLPAMVS